MFLWHWILNVTGDNVAGSRWNLAWSGFLSAGVISTSIFTHTWHSYRLHNCHAKGCWRIGRHDYTDADGVTSRLCRHCHPVLKGSRRTREDFHAHHAARTENR